MIDFWKEYQTTKDIINDIPFVPFKSEDRRAYPDVYGAVLQFYNALKYSYDNRDYETNDVLLWRGLITVLALKDYLEIPVSWEYVRLEDRDDNFSTALQYIPPIIASDDSQWGWNGKEFYVLKGKVSDHSEEDLMLYSPKTLLYPVADIEIIFEKIPEIRWYDYKTRKFLPTKNFLYDIEKKIVCYWIDKIFPEFSGNDGFSVVCHHLQMYREYLNIGIEQDEMNCFSCKKITDETGFPGGDICLNKTVKLNVKNLYGENKFEIENFFSEQIYYFVYDERSPFEKCNFMEQYEIKNKDGWYAFLPLHYDLSKYYAYNSRQISLSMIYNKRNEKNYIAVDLLLPIGKHSLIKLTKEYRICEESESTTCKNTAVKYDGSELPVIAVWPGNICSIWNKYYIFLDESGSRGNLKIYADSSLESSNKYVKQVEYVPYAIPLVRYEKNVSFSVGAITPRSKSVSLENQAAVTAEVGVDFGTSSTKVYAKIKGIDEKQEIRISEDNSMMIMGCIKGQDFLKTYFISNEDEPSYSDLFSIYIRSKDDFLKKPSPVLDGLIYRPQKNEILERDNRFMADLKWDVLNKGYYMAFLKQLCLHVNIWLFERYQVSDIAWRYALPKSMDRDVQTAIQNVWKTDIKQFLSSMSKINHTINEQLITESEAASRYFLFDSNVRRVNSNKGYLVVDIGGGSTDVALWQIMDKQVSMIWHSSVKVAGRLMFTEWFSKYLKEFVNKTNLGKELESMINIVAEEGVLSATKTALTERILNLYYEELYAVYLEEYREGAYDSWALKLCSGVTKAMAILLFALGYQIGELMNDKNFTIPKGNGNFIIALGGKGSKILDWTEHGDDNRTLLKFFQMGVVSTGTKLDYNTLKIYTSEKPKEEVAKGLLEYKNEVQSNVYNLLDAKVDVSKAERVLKKLTNTYKESYVAGNRNLEDMEFDVHRIADLISGQGEKECDVLEFFMERVYHRYLLEESKVKDANGNN